MKTINDFTFEQQQQIVVKNDSLRDMFEQYLQESEMDYLSDKLSCIKNSLSDWCIEFYGRTYICVKDYYSFCLGVEKSGKSYGLSEKCEKLLSKCFKLYFAKSNLFEYYAEKLADLFVEDEFKPTIDWVENIGMSLYRHEIPDDAEDVFICFLENDFLKGYLFDDGSDDDDEDEQDGQQGKEFDPLDISIYSPVKNRYVG